MPRTDGVATPEPTTGESALTYSWLRQSPGLAGNSPGLFTRLWAETRDGMRKRHNVRQQLIHMTDWISDYWIARGAKVSSLRTFSGDWNPPEMLRDWPSFDIGRLLTP